MSDLCVDLDPFFDGELPADQAAAFREHVAACARCQAVLHGRMQEHVAGAEGDARIAATATSDEVASRPRSRRRMVLYLGPVVAAAAVLVVWLSRLDAPAPESLALSLTVENGGPKVRSRTPHVGDMLRPAVRGERYRAIWVYLDDALVVACPGDVRCRTSAGELTLELRPTARGRYTIVALGAAGAIMEPRGTLDQALAAAETGGVHVQVSSVEVD